MCVSLRHPDGTVGLRDKPEDVPPGALSLGVNEIWVRDAGTRALAFTKTLLSISFPNEHVTSSDVAQKHVPRSHTPFPLTLWMPSY